MAIEKTFGGRPRLPKEKVRDQRVVTFLTREETEKLNSLAEQEGKFVSDSCHDLLLRGFDSLA